MSNLECSTSLPSGGLFYPEFDGNIVFRSLDTGDEQKIFGSSSNTTIDRVLNDVIIEPKGFNINSLIPGDKAYLMNKVRIHTYGSMYRQPYFCPLCSTEGEVEYDLDSIEVHTLPSTLKVPLKVKLPVSNDILELRVLNCDQINKLEDRAVKTSKNTGTDAKEVLFFLKLAKRIGSVNGDELDSFTSESYIRNMHPRDRAYIDSAYRSLKVGYSNIVEVKCPKCGKNITIPVEMTSEFFSPSSEVEFL